MRNIEVLNEDSNRTETTRVNILNYMYMSGKQSWYIFEKSFLTTNASTRSLDNLTVKGVDLYPWLGGMIGAKIFSAMDQSNQEVEACGRLHPLPKRVASIIKERRRFDVPFSTLNPCMNQVPLPPRVARKL